MVAGAYLLGSIPTGVVLARRARVDVRAVGSGNIGATNVTRALGWRVGLVTLLGDVLKGALPLILCRALGLGMEVACAAGCAAVTGHILPVFAGFRGGKGVATAFGVFLALTPPAALAALAAFVAVAVWTRIASLASLSAAISVPVALYLLGQPPVVIATGVVITGAIVWRHGENIGRLWAGTEPRFR